MRAGASAKRPASRSIRTGRVTEGSRPTAAVRSSARTHSFDSAAHGAALFDLEVEGYRYTRIGNPTVDVLERRIAELEGGIDALAVASGQTAVYYTMLNLAQAGQNIVSVPQLYGTTHTLFAHILPQLGVKVRLARSDSPAELESLIDAD